MVSNKRKTTILIMSVPIGSGHAVAAEALTQALQAYAGIEVVQADIFSFVPLNLGRILIGTYLKMLEYCPWLYDIIFHLGNKQKGSFWLRKLIDFFFVHWCKSYMEQVAPAAVLATHPTPASMVSAYKERYGVPIFLATVITDFIVHKWWLCPHVDMYFTGAVLDQKFPPQFQVRALGLPIRREFNMVTRVEARRKLGWQSGELVCLLMGGGEGILPMETILPLLQRSSAAHLKVVAVTGKNAGMEAVLQKQARPEDEIYGFTDAVPDMMMGADIIVSKAGGLTAAEALTCGLYFIIYKPLPGHECGNAAFLSNNYGVKVAEEPEDVVSLLEKYALLPEKTREQLREQEKRAFGRPDAAGEIVKAVLEQLALQKKS